MYRPNFCAECGTRIERGSWRLWTSRRFCKACDKKLGNARFLWLLVAGLLLLGGGYIAGRSFTHNDVPLLIIERRQTDDSTAKLSAATSQSNISDGSHKETSESRNQLDSNTQIISICGARTQKGTPCSRRVRAFERCWQHKGKPAMLPPEKLIVESK